MKIFISWSGELSKGVAIVLREWLRLVFHGADPFVSSEDIEKGSRGLVEIATELEQARVGIICVTRENYARPWMNFEAGAVSSKVGRTRVIPFLVNLEPHELPRNNPLTQFQAVSNSKIDIYKMVQAINRSNESSPQDETVLDTLFGAVWSLLETGLASALKAYEDTSKEPLVLNTPEDMVAEMVDLSRTHARQIAEIQSSLARKLPKSLVYLDELPPVPDEYLEFIAGTDLDKSNLRRIFNKFYQMLTNGGETPITPDEFKRTLIEIAPLLLTTAQTGVRTEVEISSFESEQKSSTLTLVDVTSNQAGPLDTEA